MRAITITIITIAIITISVIGFLAVVEVALDKGVLDLTQNQTNGTFELDDGDINFSSKDITFQKPGSLIIKVPAEKKGLVIYCHHFQYFEGQQLLPKLMWIYPICAMLETNSELEIYNYDIKFKEYNLCVYLTNNKSIGDCENELY